MDKIRVRGGKPLIGEILISGAKNAALPLMAASILTDEELVLTNLPNLADIDTMTSLISQHGVSCNLKEGVGFNRVMRLKAPEISNTLAPYEIVKKMRASVLVLAPLLARVGVARVSLPGGCAIGTRPIDMHLKALELMGAEITLDHGYVEAKVSGRLKGAEIHFEKVSVGATENTLMAASLAEGETIITNAAREPEVTDLAVCLTKMGAKIDGIGSGRLVIQGVDKLHGAEHNIIFDRIEAGTFAVAAAATGGCITLKGIIPEVMDTVFDKLEECGVSIERGENFAKISRENRELKSCDINTQPFPGFPTDMQAQFMAMLSIANGASVIVENIFENRFMHVSELMRMGANITTNGNTAIVRGVDALNGAEVMATDLRASSSLIIAALTANDETIIDRIYHLDRGYERIEEKLSACGANIQRIKENKGEAKVA